MACSIKNFLAVFDGYKMCKSTLQYAIELTKYAGAHLTGVFLDELHYYTYNVPKVVFHNKAYGEVIKALYKKYETMSNEAALQFRIACDKAHVPFSIHRNRSIAWQELKHESFFADLILISKNETFTDNRDPPPPHLIKNLLREVKCPVLIIPDEYKAINKTVLFYDGEPSSLYATKIFNYLLYDTRQLPVEVLSVKSENISDLNLPDSKVMHEFIQSHFTKAVYTIVQGKTGDQIINYLQHYGENELVVLGAYGRNVLLRWIKPSVGDVWLGH